jgi:carboxypeptidase Taq
LKRKKLLSISKSSFSNKTRSPGEPLMSQAVYDQLCAHSRETALLRSIDGLLGWDQQTKMPPAGGDYRAEQITHLSGLIHQKQTDPRIGQWLDQLAGSTLASDVHSIAGANIHGLKRSYERKIKLPQRLVEELTRASSLGQGAWVEARRAKDFASFQPHLEKIYALKR